MAPIKLEPSNLVFLLFFMRRQYFPRAFLSVWSENQFWSECDLPSVVLWLPTHLVRLFFRQFFPRFFPPSFSLKANVWLRALIYAKLPPRWFNPITFDECYLPSSRHRTSLLAYLFVPTGPGLATLFFLPRLFSKLNVEAVDDLWYMPTSPPALICNPDLHW